MEIIKRIQQMQAIQYIQQTHIIQYAMTDQNEYNNVIVLENSESSSEDEDEWHQQLAQIPIESFQELGIQFNKQLVHKYTPKSILHESCNSVVIKCQTKSKNQGNSQQNQMASQGETVAIKISSNLNKQILIYNQINQCKQDHQFLKVIEKCGDYIAFQYCKCSLRDIISNTEHLTNNIIMKVLAQITDQLAILEKIEIVHSDIKPENILCRSLHHQSQQFIICDFSSSFSIDRIPQLNQCSQTWSYQAPQWLHPNSIINSKVDIWSLGCTLFQCMTGQSLIPLEVDSEDSYQKSINQFASNQSIKNRLKRFSYGTQISKFEPLLLQLLNKDPFKRPSLKQVRMIIQKME